MTNMQLTASGFPTKEFFVDMFTRDIELADAILDLLDNCLDGAMRHIGSPAISDNANCYDGYWTRISIATDHFSISDNCGGIPLDVAKNYAFRMGRPYLYAENGDLPTVGVYGIGMKRAIFKIGRECQVLSKTNTECFRVSIPKEWFSPDSTDWNFNLTLLPQSELVQSSGTQIDISELCAKVSDVWAKDTLSTFISDLQRTIAFHYSLIMEKGYRIYVNDTLVSPNSVKLMFANFDSDKKSRLSPYLYQGIMDDVSIKIIVGLYRPLLSDDEIEEETFGKRSALEAGVTVICNDRVVLHNDKTHLTGWGEAGVPKYHNQFIGIRGIVYFQSRCASNLPMTTTKRGIDLSSPVYAATKNWMREGLKLFTDYTNKWKGRHEEERTYSAEALQSSVSVSTIIKSSTEDLEKDFNVSFTKSKRNAGREELYYSPVLPLPKNEKQMKAIRFSRLLDEIKTVAFYLWGEEGQNSEPKRVGEKCFELILEKAQEKKSK